MVSSPFVCLTLALVVAISLTTIRLQSTAADRTAPPQVRQTSTMARWTALLPPLSLVPAVVQQSTHFFVRLIHPQMSWVFTTRGRSPITGPMLSSLCFKTTCSPQPFLGACRPIYSPSQGGQLGVPLPEANPPAARTTTTSTTT